MVKEKTTLKRRTAGLAVLMALALTMTLAVPIAAQTTKAKVDLNTADLKTIAALPGIGETLAQRIIDARPFKKLDDLAAIKGVGQSKIDGLKDLVTFSKIKAPKDAVAKTEVQATAKETLASDKTKAAATADKTKTTETAAGKDEKELVNVNKADIKSLQGLPGIGDALAKRIIDGRPYKTLDDLGKVKGIGEAKLKGIKDLIVFEDKTEEKTVKTATAKETASVVDTKNKAVTTTAEKAKTTTTETAAAKTKLAPGEKLDINTATVEQLDALFGIGPVKAQAIVDYRNANGKFQTIEDIMKVKGIKEGEFAKIKDSIKVK